MKEEGYKRLLRIFIKNHVFRGIMKRKSLGKIIFWIGIAWAFIWGLVASISVSSYMHTYTAEQLSQTSWALNGPLMAVWGLLGVPLGAIIAGVGILLYRKTKTGKTLKYGIGVLLTLLVVAIIMMSLGHHKILFGVGGVLIMIFFFGILWNLSKEKNLFKLTGFTFMLIATWFTCGAASRPYLKALEGTDPGTPIHIMIFFILGWLFLFLGYRKK